MLEIRTMVKSDLATVAALAEQLGYPVALEALAARFETLALEETEVLFVAEDASGVVGWLQVGAHNSLETEPLAMIRALVVDENARRRGAGRALVWRARQWAIDQGFGRLRVRSNVLRHEAHRFYPALGFRLAKTQHNYEIDLR